MVHNSPSEFEVNQGYIVIFCLRKTEQKTLVSFFNQSLFYIPGWPCTPELSCFGLPNAGIIGMRPPHPTKKHDYSWDLERKRCCFSLYLQRTQVKFPTSTTDSSLLSITPAPRHPVSSCGLLHALMYTCKHTSTQKNKNGFFKMY